MQAAIPDFIDVNRISNIEATKSIGVHFTSEAQI